MSGDINDFSKGRERLNGLMLSRADRTIKRFLALDSSIYEDGAIDHRTKELLGLVSSTVLRCDDCKNYHLITCKDQGISDEEFVEALDTAVIVGGSITIPHIRRAIRSWEQLKG